VAAVRANRVRNELDELQAKLERTRQQSREMHAKLLVAGGRADLSAATLQSSLSKLEDERQRAELDLAGMEARLEAVQEQIKAAGDRAKEQIAGDPVIAELEKAVVARQKLVAIARERTEQGLQSPAEAAKAETDLIDARVQLLDRRESASARGGDALAPLAREMQNLSIEIRDRKARLALATKKLQPLQAVAQEFQDLEWALAESGALHRAWADAQERFRDAQRRADDVPVDRVIVLVTRTGSGDGVDSAAEPR
jgi:chromosome segregation ATPase